MGKTFDLKPGERTRVLWLYSSSIPGEVRFNAEADDGADPKGKVELVVRKWFDWKTTEFPLARRNVFPKGMSDSDYRLFVTAETPCRIEFETRHFRAEYFFKILIGMVVLAVLMPVFIYLMTKTG